MNVSDEDGDPKHDPNRHSRETRHAHQGQKTRSVFDRYDIVEEGDIPGDEERLARYLERKTPKVVSKEVTATMEPKEMIPIS